MADPVGRPAAGPGGPAPEGLEVGGAQYPPGPPDRWPAWSPLPASPGPVPGGTAAPAGGGGGPRSGLLVAALVVAGLLVVAAVASVVSSAGDDLEEAGPPSTVDLSDPAITAPPSDDPVFDPVLPEDVLPPGLPGDPEALARPLEEVLPELIAFVERTRGLPFRTEPDVQAVPDQEFVGLLEEAQAEGEADLREAAVADAALGLIPPDTDLVDVSRQAGAVGVLGFYQPETAELYVKGDVITPFVQAVIVHELTHALDDQHFDLGRLDVLAEQPDESAFGFLVLVEGTARWVETAFRDQLSPDEQAAVAVEELQLGLDQAGSLFSIPLPFLVEQQVPYATGLRFVGDLVADGGTAAVDRAYEEPPTTSEQVLDDTAYRTREAAVPLGDPPADGAVVEQGAFGAADLRLLELVGDPGAALDPSTAGELAPIDDFGGGRYVSWEDGGDRCARFVVVSDAEGASEVRAIVERWAAAASGAEVVRAQGPTGVQLTATRCA